MSDFTTVKTQIQKLIDTANEKTGKADADLTGAVGSLVEGYGTGGSVPRVPACEVSVKEGETVTVEIPVNVSAVVEVTSESLENETTHALYNGVRLPAIPKDVLVSNPCCFIRHNTSSGYYELYCSSEALFYISDNNAIGTYNGTTQVQRYRILIGNAETADTWEYNSTSTGPYGVEAYRPILWSNCDILYKGNSEIYFAGSEPIATN